MRLRRNARLGALEADHAALRAEFESARTDLSILWAIAPSWLTACLPYAGATGWTVEITANALWFRHEETRGEAYVSLPLGDLEAQEQTRQELYSRLGFIGPRGVVMTVPPQSARPRIMDLRGA